LTVPSHTAPDDARPGISIIGAPVALPVTSILKAGAAMAVEASSKLAVMAATVWAKDMAFLRDE